jgi:hypothetical protein
MQLKLAVRHCSGFGHAITEENKCPALRMPAGTISEHVGNRSESLVAQKVLHTLSCK